MTQFEQVFQDAEGQYIRLPREYHIDSNEVCVEKIGKSILLIPKEKNKWDVMRNSLARMEKFEFERSQPEMQERTLF